MTSARQASRLSRPSRSTSWVYNAKNVLLFLIPLSLTLYTASLFLSISGMEILAWATCALTVIYILIDRVSQPHEFEFFGLSVDFPLFLLVVIAFAGLMMNPVKPETSIVEELGRLRWIPLTYLLAYTFQITPALNRSLSIMLATATAVAIYAIVQHFSGIDLLQELGISSKNSVILLPGTYDTFISVGFFNDPLALGFICSLLVGFPFAALLIGQRRPAVFKWGMALIVLILSLSAIWSYGHSVWIALLAGLITVSAFVGRRFVVVLGIIGAIAIFSAYKLSPEFHDHVTNIFTDTDMNASDRRDLWHANLKMFEENPWVGVGLGQNEFRLPEFYKDIKVTKSTVGDPIQSHAHNTYFQWMATTGFLGFACYMIFILLTLLMTMRLWNEVPQTHYWHRVFVLGSLAAQVACGTGGLTQWNLGIQEVNHVFVFILAWTLYLGRRYGKDIIPDDFAL